MRSSLLLLLCAFQARAEVIDAQIQTLVAGRSDPRDGKLYTVVPVYQTLNIVASELKLKYVDDFKIVVGAWGTPV